MSEGTSSFSQVNRAPDPVSPTEKSTVRLIASHPAARELAVDEFRADKAVRLASRCASIAAIRLVEGGWSATRAIFEYLRDLRSYCNDLGVPSEIKTIEVFMPAVELFCGYLNALVPDWRGTDLRTIDDIHQEAINGWSQIVDIRLGNRFQEACAKALVQPVQITGDAPKREKLEIVASIAYHLSAVSETGVFSLATSSLARPLCLKNDENGRREASALIKTLLALRILTLEKEEYSRNRAREYSFNQSCERLVIPNSSQLL